MGVPWVGRLLGGGTSVLELWLSCAVVKVPKFVVFKNRRVNYSGSGTVTTGTLFPHSGERPEGGGVGSQLTPRRLRVCALGLVLSAVRGGFSSGQSLSRLDFFSNVSLPHGLPASSRFHSKR